MLIWYTGAFGPTWRSYKLTIVRPSVRPFLRSLPTFLEIGSLVFLIFGTKVQNGNAQNVTEPDFRKNLGKFGPKTTQKWHLELSCYA